MMNGCLKELKRLKKHYLKECESNPNPYSFGIVMGLEMAIEVIKNKKFYGDED